jgi:hypothetical protein
MDKEFYNHNREYLYFMWRLTEDFQDHFYYWKIGWSIDKKRLMYMIALEEDIQ